MHEPMVTLDLRTYVAQLSELREYLTTIRARFNEIIARLDVQERVHGYLIEALDQWEIDHDDGKFVRCLVEKLAQAHA